MVIVHSTDIGDTFNQISGSGGSRYADMMAMMDPELKDLHQETGHYYDHLERSDGKTIESEVIFFMQAAPSSPV